jgi:phage-related protein
VASLAEWRRCRQQHRLRPNRFILSSSPTSQGKPTLLGGMRVMEIVERYRKDAYRAIYTAHFDDVVYVLHVFQKKSKSGIATPKHEIDLIRRRFDEAVRHHGKRQN